MHRPAHASKVPALPVDSCPGGLASKPRCKRPRACAAPPAQLPWRGSARALQTFTPRPAAAAAPSNVARRIRVARGASAASADSAAPGGRKRHADQAALPSSHLCPGRAPPLASTPAPPCRLDILRKVVPHRDRANTAAFLEEVIAYVLGLKKRLAEVEGVSEADLQVPAVDVQPVLNGTAVTASALPAPATVMGNPTASSSATPQGGEHRPGGTAMGGPVPMGAVAVPAGGMPHMMPPFRDVAIGGPAEQDAVGGVAKGLNTARGLPTPAMNPNQVRRRAPRSAPPRMCAAAGR